MQGCLISEAEKLIDLLVSATGVKSYLSGIEEGQQGKKFFEGIETSCSIEKTKIGSFSLVSIRRAQY